MTHEELVLNAEQLVAGIDAERLKALFSAVPAAVVVLSGPTHIYRFASDRYAELVGAHRPLIGLTVAQAVPEAVDQGFIELLDAVYSTGEPYFGHEMPVELRRTDGGPTETRFLDCVLSATSDATGHVDGVLFHGVDVTELVLARGRSEELNHNLDTERDRLGTLIEHMPAGVVITDPSGNITEVNHIFREFFQVPVDALNDMSSWEVFEGFRPDGSRYAVNEYPLARTVLHGETVIAEQIEFRSRTGETRITEVSTVPIRNQEGSIISGVAVFSDITERHVLQTELATRRAHEQAQVQIDKVFDSAGDGIWVLDSNGRTTLLNKAAQSMTGFTPEELLGEVSHHKIHHSYPDGEPYPIDKCPIYRSVSRGEDREIDSEVFWRKDGTSFPVSYRTTPIYDRGQQIGAVQVFRDLTRQRELEAHERQARETEMSKSQALQLNDDIMQGLIVAQMSLELGEVERAQGALNATIAAMKRIINALLTAPDETDLNDGRLVRAAAAGSFDNAGNSHRE